MEMESDIIDMDGLEEVLSKKDITQEQFNLALETSHRLIAGTIR